MGLFSQSGGEKPDFDSFDDFVPEHLPEPGPQLAEHEVLDGDDHVEVHHIAREVFEERGVYDTTFGYNLAKLNLDPRHPDAGFRYAVEDDDVLHAEFTPTTAFCPQGEVLTTAANRALNGLADRHEFDRVAVHIADVHQHSEAINEGLDSPESHDSEPAQGPLDDK
jgi:hypothetical protein